MKILCGEFKNKKLLYAKNRYIRPTRNIIKKSFFDTIRSLIDTSVFLDLFAGIGSVGIEAISCGAKNVIFVEKNKYNCKIIKNNIDKLKKGNSIEIYKMDVVEFLKTYDIKHVDIVYIDPPYGLDIEHFLSTFFKSVNENAFVCIEHKKNKVLKKKYKGFCCVKERFFSNTVLSYYGSSCE